MSKLLFLSAVGTVGLIASLYLEAETSGTGSAAYKKLKYVGGTGACMSWIGLTILWLLSQL